MRAAIVIVGLLLVVFLLVALALDTPLADVARATSGAVTGVDPDGSGGARVEEKKPVAPYTEFVTVRHFENGRLLDPLADVSAWRGKDTGGKAMINLKAPDVNAPPKPGTEVTDSGGKVFVVEKAERAGGAFSCYVREKP